MATTAQTMAVTDRRRTPRLGIVLAVVVALGLVTFGVFAASRRWAAPETPHLVSMAEGAQAMQRAAATMRTHGQAMLDDGRRTGDQELVAQGEHWVQDGQTVAQGARWMAMDPTAGGSLLASPADLAAQGSWGELNRGAQAMLHDPRGARQVDLEALRWAGLGMQGEGQNMAEHGRLMAEQVELMVAKHNLDAPGATDLRQAARTMDEVGGHLMQNGQAMVAYADQLRRAMALR